MKTLLKNKQYSRYLKKGLILMVCLYVVDLSMHAILKKGLASYYGMNGMAEIALIGHSHVMLGIDKTTLERDLGKNIAKYTREGVNVFERNLMIDQILIANPNIKTLIYGVDAWMFTGEGLSYNSYTQFYPFMDTPHIDDYMYKNTSVGDYWQHKWIKTSRYNEMLLAGAMRGYLQKWDNFKFGAVDTVQLKKDIALNQYRKINSSKINRNLFETSLTKLAEKNIKIILLYVPTIDLYNQTEPEEFNNEIAYYKSLENRFNGLIFLNYLEPFSHDYSLFFDKIHLNPKGQEKITQRLITDLKGW